MSITRRKIVILALLVVIAGVLSICFIRRRHNVAADPIYVNSMLAIRGFRHGVLEVPPGDSKTYRVDVGEDFKVTWRTGNLSENGQLFYRGPKGIGAGLVSVPFQQLASESGDSFLEFIPAESGTATFILTATGPGLDGTYTITNTLIVTITP